VINTSKLDGVTHRYGDLTATLGAGATLAAVNRELARHGQWLPLDSAFDGATIGGLVASNDSGPLRHRFGTPRDLIIGVQLATVDGALAKAGGQVVKNVAGYDLSKLLCGSFGSLAAIVSATFKLTPLPSASKTIAVNVSDVDTLGQIVRDVMSSQLEPIAFEVHVQPRRPPGTQSNTGSADSASSAVSVLLRFASLPSVVDAQVAQALALPSVKGGSTTVTNGDAERELWEQHAKRMWDSPGAIVRASWLPAEITAVMKGRATGTTGTTAGATPTVTEMIGRVATGAGLLRLDGDARSQAAAIEQLRRSTPLRNVVIVRGSDELKSLVDVWGPMGDREKLFASLKRTLDPHGVLNAGRGPL